MEKNKERLRCSRNWSFESHSKCRPRFSAEGWHEGCPNDSLLWVVGDRCLYRKFCILWHKVTAQHTHCRAHSRHSKMFVRWINTQMSPAAPGSIFQLLSLLKTDSKDDSRSLRTVLVTTFWTHESFKFSIMLRGQTHTSEGNAEPPEKKLQSQVSTFPDTPTAARVILSASSRADQRPERHLQRETQLPTPLSPLGNL